MVLGMFVLHGAGWADAIFLGVGGVVVVFSASEVIIKSVEGIVHRTEMNTFVVGNRA